MIGVERPGVDAGAVEDAGLDRHLRDEGQAEAVVDHLHQRVQRGAHHRRLGAQLGPVAGGERMVLEAMAVLEQQQPVLVDRVGVDRSRRRRLAAREGDEQAVVEQVAHVDVAAGEGHRQQHAVELAAVERVAGRLAGLLAQEELEARAIARAAAAASPAAGTGRWSGSRPSAARRCSGWPSARAMSASSSASRSTRRALSAIRSPSGVKRTTRRVRSTRVTPSRVSSSRRPADRVDWVTKQASAALPKWPCSRSATRYCSCLMVGRWTVIGVSDQSRRSIIDLVD